MSPHAQGCDDARSPDDELHPPTSDSRRVVERDTDGFPVVVEVEDTDSSVGIRQPSRGLRSGRP